ncbi:MAG: hypothetical protein QNJ98_16610 [Planctomycetota bacterium]|nr:hypothetical protein [Planctomycetota bacterium]
MARDAFPSDASEDEPHAEPARRRLPTWVGPSMPVFILMGVIGYFMFTQEDPPHFQAEPATPPTIDAGTDAEPPSDDAASDPTQADAPEQPDTPDADPARPDKAKQPDRDREDSDPPIPPR